MRKHVCRKALRGGQLIEAPALRFDPRLSSSFQAAGAVTVGEVLDGHVQLDLECLDRVYLNGYLAQVQVGGWAGGAVPAAPGFPGAVPGVLAADR